MHEFKTQGARRTAAATRARMSHLHSRTHVTATLSIACFHGKCTSAHGGSQQGVSRGRGREEAWEAVEAGRDNRGSREEAGEPLVEGGGRRACTAGRRSKGRGREEAGEGVVLGDAGGPRDPLTHLPPLPHHPWPSFPNTCEDKTEVRSRRGQIKTRRVRKINPSRLSTTKTRTDVERS